MNWTAEQIAAATGGRIARPGPAGPVLTDTRALVPGAWFLALIGDRFDGHDFLRQAVTSGAVGCIVETVPEECRGGVVVVEDTTAALQNLGRAARDRLRGPVVGITGSSGKTTTRALTALALSPLGEIHQSAGNLNNELGVPMTLLAAAEGAAASVVELGTNAPGEIRFLAELCRPDVRLIVNVGPAHLEELGGLEGVAAEKGALFATARPGDVACVNLDDAQVAALPLPDGVRRVTWGRSPEAEVRVLEVEIQPARMHTVAHLETPGGEVRVDLPAPGRHLATNAAAALAVAVALGVDPLVAGAALAAYEPVGMRLRIEDLPGGAVALNDAYNANPQSVEASLRTLAELPGRRAAVLGDMLELGHDEAAWHERTASLAASLGLDLLVLVGPRMAAAEQAAEGPTEVWAAEEGTELVDQLAAWLRPGDHVLFKGSRGARVERILHELQGTDSED